jgi:homoserine kinase
MTVRRAMVSVPGSTSNIGGGFDCVGMAVDRWLTASVEIDADVPGVRMTRSGALAALRCNALDDYLYAGFVAACRRSGAAVPTGLSFKATSAIPVARGLGSSAAALVAGAGLADAAFDLGLGADGVAQLVSELEGHPDNAAPSAFGGAMLGVARSREANASGGYIFSSLPVAPSLAFVFAVPSIEVSTAEARAVLPVHVPFGLAVQALQRSAALVHGLATGSGQLLAAALDDVLHVPFRRGLVPGYDAVVVAARHAGAFGATLSGSGSAMLAIGSVQDAPAIAAGMQSAFEAHGLSASCFVSAGAVGGLRSGD